MLGDIDPALVTIKDWNPVVYTGRDRVPVATFMRYDRDRRRDVPLDFSAVTRMVLTLPAIDAVWDTLVVPGVMIGAADGSVAFDLSSYDVAPGVYDAQLVVFDAEHPRGQVIVSGYQTDRDFKFSFQDVGGSGAMPIPLPATDVLIRRPAGETISALRVVYELGGKVYLLDPLDPAAKVNLLLGVAVTAGEADDVVSIRSSGSLDDPSFDWDEGPVYVGLGGRLTQEYPATGWELVAGASPAPTRVNLDFDEPVLLAQD